MSVLPNNATKNCHILSLSCHFVASFYRHVTNIVTEFVTSVVLSYHLVAAMWLSYVRQSNYIATLATLCHLLCCHVTDVVIEVVVHCHCLAAIYVWFAQQRNQNCHTLSVCCRVVASFYRHVTNIVTEFVTSVVLSYHLVAAMWLSYVWQSNYIATLATVCRLLCCHVTDVVLKLVTLCHHLVAICACFTPQRKQNCRTLSVCCRFVAPFYRHVTNIVTEFDTSVVLSYHLVAAMWLSYVRQSNYIATLVTVLPPPLLSCN